MAEALLAENKNKIKLARKRKTMVKKTTDDGPAGSGQVGGQANDSDLSALVAELDGGGYIIEGGGIQVIDHPSLDGLNKLAMNVIQTQVSDHYDDNLDEDANFEKLRGNLMQVLEKNASTARSKTIKAEPKRMLADGAREAVRKATSLQVDNKSTGSKQVPGSKMTEINEQALTEASIQGMSDANQPRRVSKRKTSKLREQTQQQSQQQEDDELSEKRRKAGRASFLTATLSIASDIATTGKVFNPKKKQLLQDAQVEGINKMPLKETLQPMDGVILYEDVAGPRKNADSDPRSSKMKAGRLSPVASANF